jgi:hypothetical protein
MNRLEPREGRELSNVFCQNHGPIKQIIEYPPSSLSLLPVASLWQEWSLPGEDSWPLVAPLPFTARYSLIRSSYLPAAVQCCGGGRVVWHGSLRPITSPHRSELFKSLRAWGAWEPPPCCAPPPKNPPSTLPRNTDFCVWKMCRIVPSAQKTKCPISICVYWKNRVYK